MIVLTRHVLESLEAFLLLTQDDRLHDDDMGIHQKEAIDYVQGMVRVALRKDAESFELVPLKQAELLS